MVRLTDRPDMTLDVYRARKTTTQQQQQPIKKGGKKEKRVASPEGIPLSLIGIASFLIHRMRISMLRVNCKQYLQKKAA